MMAISQRLVAMEAQAASTGNLLKQASANWDMAQTQAHELRSLVRESNKTLTA